MSVVRARVAFLSVVEPDTPVAVALHSTWTESPSTGKGPKPPGEKHGGVYPV